MGKITQTEINLIKEILEFARKSPDIIKLQQECEEFKSGNREEIQQKTIDNAFDAFEVIVKQFANSMEEYQKLSKLLAKQLFADILIRQGVKITT